MEEKFRILLDRMMVLCSKREYCEADIRKRLEKEALKSGYPEEPGIWQQAVDGIVDTLKREKYIDDSRYARAFVRDKSSISGWGRVKINSVPTPSVLMTLIFSLWAWMISFTMARPRPVPFLSLPREASVL